MSLICVGFRLIHGVLNSQRKGEHILQELRVWWGACWESGTIRKILVEKVCMVLPFESNSCPNEKDELHAFPLPNNAEFSKKFLISTLCIYLGWIYISIWIVIQLHPIQYYCFTIYMGCNFFLIIHFWEILYTTLNHANSIQALHKK